jgi:hypothetical protein
MPPNNNRGRLLNDGLNTSVFADLETVRTPAGLVGSPGLQYPEEVGSEVMPNFMLITVYDDQPAQFDTTVKAQNKRGNPFGLLSNGLGGVAGSAVNVAGNLFDFGAFSEATNRSNESFVASTRVGGRYERRPVESIALYIPGSIAVEMAAGYESKETERRGWAGVAGGWIRGAMNKVRDALRPGGEDNRLLSSGRAKNPNKEIAFKDITERSFTFEYTFVPKTPKETDAAYNIIRTLRYHSHPELASATQFKVPAEFEIQFFTNGRENQWIPRFRRLVCDKINVTYGDDEGLATFEDGAPAYITASIGFKEVEPLHKGHIKAGF